jgi:hypothetical protein
MKKAILCIGSVVFFALLTSCTAEELDYGFKSPKNELKNEYNESNYSREGDTIIAVPVINIPNFVDGDPILKPKKNE